MMRLLAALALLALASAPAHAWPHGGGAVSAPADPTIPPVGDWAQLTTASQGGFFSATLPVTCANYEGQNPTACAGNASGSAAFTGSITTTALAVTAVSSGTINDGDQIAGTGVTAGSYVTAGGPCTSGTTPCSLTVSASQSVVSESMVANAPALQASSIGTTIDSAGFGTVLAYGNPAVDSFGNVFFSQNGGHSASQGVGVLEWKMSDAVSGGGTASWNLMVKPPRFLPLSAGSPPWSNQSSGVGDLIASTNLDGQMMPIAVHNYNALGVSTEGYMGMAGIFGGTTGNDNMGSAYFYDPSAPSANWQGPLTLARTCIGGSLPACSGGLLYQGLEKGYMLTSNTGVPTSSAWGPDGNRWGVANDGNGYVLSKLTCPFGGYGSAPCSPVWHYVIGDSFVTCWPGWSPAVVIPDPASAAHLVYASYNGGTDSQSGCTPLGRNTLYIASDIDGTPALHTVTLTGDATALTHECDNEYICTWGMAWDPDDGWIIVSDGSEHLLKITLTYGGGSYSGTVAELTSSPGGTTPPAPTTTACDTGGAEGSIAGVGYRAVNGIRLAVMSYCGDVFQYDISQNGCPSGDGSVITAPTACTLTDGSGNVWSFGTALVTQLANQKQLNYNVLKNGSATLAGYQMALAQSGGLFARRAACGASLWTNAAGYQVPSPTGAAATEHAIVAPGPTDYYTLHLAGESGLNALQTQTIEITAQAGIPFWIDSEYMGHGGTGPFTGLTISGDPGASLACSFDNESGTATIRVKNNMPSMTITGLSIGDVHTISGNSYLAAVQIDQGETGVTISDSTLHDSDFGLLAGGNGNGTLTLTNDIIINNGSGITSSGAGLQHGMYLSWNGTSPDTDNAIISGGEDENVIGSVYEGGGTDAGSIAKIRYANATITNYTIASTTTCKAQSIAPTPCNASQENWPLQFPCGGYYTVGEADVGATKNGVVIERSPNAVKWALVSSGDEAASAGTPPNCPATNRASQTLTLANDIFIDDGPATDEAGSNHVVAAYVPTTTGVTCSFANSVFVGPNWTGLTTGAHPAITSPCTDGGGNSFYPGRASAGLQPWPALPSPP